MKVDYSVKSAIYLTQFHYASLASKWWAFTMMGKAHNSLKEVEGLSFYKLMGSGRSMGFNPLPDFSTYALLTVWETDEQAQNFFNHSGIYRQFRSMSSEQWSLGLEPIQSKGTWDGHMPFGKAREVNHRLPVLVLTRATIRMSKSIKFWRYVPISYRPLVNAAGLRYTKGIGEWPFTQMATISLWDNHEAINKFAYGSEEHRKAIKMTKELNWYKEEMFARFHVVKSTGTWNGANPLAALSPD